jgi:hypothetical protein
VIDSRPKHLSAALARLRRIAAATAIALVGCGGATREHAPAPAFAPPATPSRVETIADRFITTFWCGPPLDAFDDDRAREIAAAGFNLIGASCEGPVTPFLNKRALRIAQRHGLDMLIKDARLSAAQPLQAGWQDRASNAIASYRDFDALAGVFLVDEPGSAQAYPDIAALRARIRREAPGKIGYVNLLPRYAFAGPADYREYVESYTFQTEPDLLSYDHYPFLEGSDRPTFFENLLVFRQVAREYDIPFMVIVQLMPHYEYRDVDDAELAWQVFHALAFGARGISYFAYWTPTQVPDNLAFRFRKGIIEGGLPTEHYRRVARLNPRLRAIAAELSEFRPAGLWDSRGELGDSKPPRALGAVDAGEIVVGEFESRDGRWAALAVNRDYRTPARLTLTRPESSEIEVFDDVTGSWSLLHGTLDLPPGEGRLVRSTGNP